MRHLWTAVLALPFLAAPAAAQSCAKGGVVNFGFGANFTFYGSAMGMCGPGGCGPGGYGGGGGGGGGAPAQAGPWYLYWPMEAHFNTPAPTGYPYWPGPQTMPQSGATPASYTPGAPSYWYGR
jgi:hypothetical protein